MEPNKFLIPNEFLHLYNINPFRGHSNVDTGKGKSYDVFALQLFIRSRVNYKNLNEINKTTHTLTRHYDASFCQCFLIKM